MLPSLSRHDRAELLDHPSQVLPDLPGNLRDLRRLNRLLAGRSIALHFVRMHARASTTMLDVATGSADIPLAAVRWAQRSQAPLRITACDISEEVLAEARNVVGDAPINLARADARSLPWPDRSFDLVTCNLALHHFGPSDAEQALREMWRVSRRVMVVIDLERGYTAYIGTWLATHVLVHNRLTRSDGPLSVLRAYTAQEVGDLARRAGLDHFTIRRHPLFRISLEARRKG